MFSLGDPDELRRLVQDAGFHDVRVLARWLTAHFPSGHEFVEFELGFDPAEAPALRERDPSDQQRVMDELRGDLMTRLGPRVDDGALVLQMHAYVVTAVRRTA